MTVKPSTSRGSELTSSEAAAVRALGERTVEDPIAPCVFFQEGIDWRWLAWEALAGRVLDAVERLGGGAALSNLEIAFPSQPTVVALVLDLALQHVGAVPRPLPGEARAAWIARGRPWVESSSEPELEASELAVGVEGAAGRWRRAREAEVEAIATGCSARLPARRSRLGGWGLAAWLRRPAEREVVVDVLELERPLCRAGVAWTLARGGALVLAHERASLEAAARWARPTRFWAETAEGRFERLAAAALAGAGRRKRLVSALWSGAVPPTEATRAALESGGVELAEWRPANDSDESGRVEER